MYKRHFMVYGLTILLGSLLLFGCNNGDTTSSSDEDATQSQLEINVAQLLSTNECEGCDLAGADLSRSNLRSAKLMDANLNEANLAHSNLFRADLYAADLRHANLQNANMQDADLKHALMQYANLKDADLTGADMTGGTTSHFNTRLRFATWTDGSTCETQSCDGKAY